MTLLDATTDSDAGGMTPADEQKVMQAFYDRIFQMVTYTPTSGQGQGVSLFDPQTTLVQLDTGGSINLADFTNMVTPINVGKKTGDLRASETFYRRFDLPGGIGAKYQPESTTIGDVYSEIINGANATVKPTAEEVAQYNNVRKFLVTEVEQTDPVTQKTTKVTVPTQNFTDYKTFKGLYLNALSAYRSAYLTYDMTNPEDQRKWEAQAPVLEGNLSTAWQNWVAQGDKQQVEEALNFLAASDNNIVANIISDAKQELQAGKQSSLTGDGSGFYISYGAPFHWWDAAQDSLWMDFTLNANYLYTSDSSYYKKTEGSAGSSFLGLISWGGGGGSTTQAKYHHMTGTNLSISAKMMTVTIERPWFSNALFKTNGWKLTGQTPGYVSDGKLDANNANALMPVVPTAFVLVKDVQITANWTEQDSAALSTATQAKGGISFGPFHAGGDSGSSSSSNSSVSNFKGGTLSLPGTQVVAWVNQITPLSPPE